MNIELTAEARKHLRRLGRTLSPAVQVGKSGLTEALVRQVARALGGRDLVKIKALDTCGDPIDDVGARLAGALDAVVVATAGRTALLYRPNPDLTPDKRSLS